MSDEAIIRDYRPSDFEAIKAIHEATRLDYSLPAIDSRLFFVKKVLEVDGIVRACGASYLQAEIYLWMDPNGWALPDEKLLAIKELDREVMESTWLAGVQCAVLWLPPGMERFGKRLSEDLGFTKDRDGWVSYSKPTRRKQ